jgi:uncharacterized protein (DUF2147 family)
MKRAGRRAPPGRQAMRRAIRILAAAAIAVGAGEAGAQAAGPGDAAAKAPAKPASPFAPLVGRWVRPDGGYVVTVRSAAPDGKLDASYANPRPLPFSKALARLKGKGIEVVLELQAGGYAGSTYLLTYDPGADALVGAFHQAVARQTFDVRFERLR